MEWAALHLTLGRLFHGHEFYCLPTVAEVETQQDIEFPIPSFTSCDVKRILGKPNNADKLVERAAAEAVGNRSRDAADLVVIVDDVEPHNRLQPAAVISVMREAAERYIARLSDNVRAQNRHSLAMRTKVSFHMLMPMVESWLFPDMKALARAGVPMSRVVKIVPNTDPEHFQTADTAYDADDGASCTCWHGLTGYSKKKCKPQWLKADPDRRFHPKAYLSWLCIAPAEKTCSAYAETEGGAAALGELDWSALLGDPRRATFARALVHDIADALGVDEPFPGEVARETALNVLPRVPILRNI